MLVLTRNEGERVVFTDRETGQEIGSIMVVCLPGGGRVRLGFEFPDNMRILRAELGPLRIDNPPPG